MQALFIGLKGVGTLFSVVLLLHCLVHFAVNLRLPDTTIESQVHLPIIESSQR